MTKRQKLIVQRFMQVQRFLEANPAALPLEAEETRERLDAAIASLTAPQQGGQARTFGYKTVVEARHQLHELHVRPLAAAARIALPPELAPMFYLPDVTTPVCDMIVAAKIMAERAVANRYALVEAGLAPDFVEQLHAAILALESALRSSHRDPRRGRQDHTVATARNIEEGHRAVRGLDAVVRPMLADDRHLLSAWDAAKRSTRAVRAAAGGEGA